MLLKSEADWSGADYEFRFTENRWTEILVLEYWLMATPSCVTGRAIGSMAWSHMASASPGIREPSLRGRTCGLNSSKLYIELAELIAISQARDHLRFTDFTGR